MRRINEGRVAVVTGAGRGIGRGHALELARQGAKVVVNDLGAEVDGRGSSAGPAGAVVEAIRAAGGEAVANGDDVSEWDGARHLVETAIGTFGGLDVLVNNAGILRDRMLVNMSIDEWDAVIKVHLRGTFATVRWSAEYWRDRAEQGQHNDARIINTTSATGLFGNVGQANYGAAKAGIAALTIVAAGELGRYGVTVNAINPGAHTRMTEQARPGSYVPVEPGAFDVSDPENIAPFVTWLASPESSPITGRVFTVRGGQIRVLEGWHAGPSAVTRSSGGKLPSWARSSGTSSSGLRPTPTSTAMSRGGRPSYVRGPARRLDLRSRRSNSGLTQDLPERLAGVEARFTRKPQGPLTHNVSLGLVGTAGNGRAASPEVGQRGLGTFGITGIPGHGAGAADLDGQPCVHRAVRPAEELDVGGDPRGQAAELGHLSDTSTQSPSDEIIGVGSGQLLPDDRIVESSDLPGQSHEVGCQRAGTLERGAILGSPRASLEYEHRLGHRPARVDLAESVGIGDHDVVQEFLAELGHFVDLPYGPDGETGSVAGHEEPGQAPMFGGSPICTGEAHGRIGQVSEGAPDLLAVEDPLFAVASGSCPSAGKVGSRRWLREELADQLLSRQDPRHEPAQEFG